MCCSDAAKKHVLAELTDTGKERLAGPPALCVCWKEALCGVKRMLHVRMQCAFVDSSSLSKHAVCQAAQLPVPLHSYCPHAVRGAEPLYGH